MIGEVGYVGLIERGRPCQIEAGTLRPVRAVDVAPSGAFAIVVGDNRDAGTEPFMAVLDLTGLPQ